MRQSSERVPGVPPGPRPPCSRLAARYCRSATHHACPPMAQAFRHTPAQATGGFANGMPLDLSTPSWQCPEVCLARSTVAKRPVHLIPSRNALSPVWVGRAFAALGRAPDKLNLILTIGAHYFVCKPPLASIRWRSMNRQSFGLDVHRDERFVWHSPPRSAVARRRGRTIHAPT